MADLNLTCGFLYARLLAALDYQDPRQQNQVSNTHKDRKYITPVASYGLAVWTPGDDLNFLCMVDISLSTFWEYAQEALNTVLEPANLQVTLPFELDIFEDVETSSLAASGTRIFLHACTLPRTTNILEHPLRPPGYETTNANPAYGTAKLSHTLQSKKLNMYRDMRYILDTSPDIDFFRQAVLFLKTWARAQGFYSHTSGFLDSDGIVWMLAKIAIPHCPSSFSKLLQDFFNEYTALGWSPTPNTAPIEKIYTHYEPRVNVAKTTMTTRQTLFPIASRIQAETINLKNLRQGIWVYTESESHLSDEDPEVVWMRSLHRDWSDSHPTMDLVNIVVSAEHWSTNPRKRLEFSQWVEREVCVSLIQALKHAYPEYPWARFAIWPAP